MKLFCILICIVLVQLYKEKEKIVCVAEDDQDNQFKQLAEQLESQNEENINTAIMNCKYSTINNKSYQKLQKDCYNYYEFFGIIYI